MTPQTVAFLEQVTQDSVLRTRVEAAARDSGCAGDVVDIAAEAGYEVSIEELLAACEQITSAPVAPEPDRTLSDEQLDGVSGGGSKIFQSFDFTPLKGIASNLTCCGECIDEHEARWNAPAAA